MAGVAVAAAVERAGVALGSGAALESSCSGRRGRRRSSAPRAPPSRPGRERGGSRRSSSRRSPRPSARGAAASPAHRPGGRSGSARGRADTSARDRWAGSSAPPAMRDRGTLRSPDVRPRRPPLHGTLPRRHTQVAETGEAGKNGERRRRRAQWDGTRLLRTVCCVFSGEPSASKRINEHWQPIFPRHLRRCTRCPRR